MTETALSGVVPCFQIKSAHVPLTAIELNFFDAGLFEETLRDKIRQAPGFFRDIPMVISLEKYQAPTAELDFFQLIGICRRHNIHVFGVRGGDEDQRRMARNASLSLLPGTGRSEKTAQESHPPAEPSAPESAPVEAAAPAERPAVPARIINQPVRSGQQIYAPEGDLVIVAPVQPGAEVLAAGNIHVYGPLRGRALAGVHGQETAQVFCQSLEAELVSIAGHYKISEDLQDSAWKAPAQIRLMNDTLAITRLDKT